MNNSINIKYLRKNEKHNILQNYFRSVLLSEYRYLEGIV